MTYFNLERFVEAQDRFNDYETAKKEIEEGEKQSHWIWYIFPQIKGLGQSGNSQAYAIESLFEACAYLQHPVLGPRLYEISEVLYDSNYGRDIEDVMGSHIDVLKLKSSMTLFELAAPDSIFTRILEHFFGGNRDRKTMLLLVDEPDWLLGKDAFHRNGINTPTVRAFLEGIDTENFSSDQLLATNLDLICKGNTMVHLCMNHLVNHGDIFGDYRPHDIEVKMSSYMYQLLDEVIAKVDTAFSDEDAAVIKNIYQRLDETDFEYCLEVAELFDEIVKFVMSSSQLRPILDDYIQYYTLIK